MKGAVIRLFRRPEAAQPETTPADCVHGLRIPHWDRPEDMGDEERASYFTCESCGKQLTPEEHRSLGYGTPVTEIQREAA